MTRATFGMSDAATLGLDQAGDRHDLVRRHARPPRRRRRGRPPAAACLLAVDHVLEHVGRLLLRAEGVRRREQEALGVALRVRRQPERRGSLSAASNCSLRRTSSSRPDRHVSSTASPRGWSRRPSRCCSGPSARRTRPAPTSASSAGSAGLDAASSPLAASMNASTEATTSGGFSVAADLATVSPGLTTKQHLAVARARVVRRRATVGP